MPMSIDSPVNPHHAWIRVSHPYMTVSLKLIAIRLFGVSKCDDWGSMCELSESRMSDSAKNGRYAAFYDMICFATCPENIWIGAILFPFATLLNFSPQRHKEDMRRET